MYNTRCDRCKLFKKGCDREMPCSRCKKQGVPCNYRPIEKTEEIAKEVSKKLKVMQKRLMELKKLGISLDHKEMNKQVALIKRKWCESPLPDISSRMLDEGRMIALKLYIDTYFREFLYVFPFINQESLYQQLETKSDTCPLISVICLRSHRFVQYRLKGVPPVPLEKEQLYHRTKTLLAQSPHSLQKAQAYLTLAQEEIIEHFVTEPVSSVNVAQRIGHTLGINETQSSQDNLANDILIERELTWQMGLYMEALCCFLTKQPLFHTPKEWIYRPFLNTAKRASKRLYIGYTPNSLCKTLVEKDITTNVDKFGIEEHTRLVFQLIQKLGFYFPEYVTPEYLLGTSMDQDPELVFFYFGYVNRALVIMCICIALKLRLSVFGSTSPNIPILNAIITSTALETGKLYVNFEVGRWKSTLTTYFLFPYCAIQIHYALEQDPLTAGSDLSLTCKAASNKLIPLFKTCMIELRGVPKAA